MLAAVRPWDSFILGTGRSQTQSSCQCKPFVQTELLLQPPSREAAEIQATAMKQGELPQGEAPVFYSSTETGLDMMENITRTL